MKKKFWNLKFFSVGGKFTEFSSNLCTAIYCFQCISSTPLLTNTEKTKKRTFERICIYGRKIKLLPKGMTKMILTIQKKRAFRRNPSEGIFSILNRNFCASVRIFSNLHACFLNFTLPPLSFYAHKPT